MSLAIGIDLGTTNTVVAAVVDGVAVTLEDEHKRRLLPSVVSFHPSGTVLVGEPARERRLIDPENTVFSIKPLIGRAFDSEEVKSARSRFPFQLVEGAKSSTMVMARDVAYALPEISAFVLRRAKAVAEKALGEVVDRAVITVPANFNDLQRASTKIAGKLAGLEVMRILNEPTAAALAYGQSIAKAEKIAVYDFGGGTFDVTLLDLTGNVFEVLATAGDTALGGDDVDGKVADFLAMEVIKRFNYDPRTNPVAFGRLRFLAEEIKKAVSVDALVEREITGIGYTEGGQPIAMKLRVTRDDIERIARPLVERTVSVARQSIEIIGLSPRDFDRVLLVGGSTRMPLVARMVEQLFEKPPHLKVNPDEVVALGAAIQAHALNRSKGAVAKRKSGHDALAKTPLGTPAEKAPAAATSVPNPHAVSVPRAARIPTGIQNPNDHPTPAAGTPQYFELSKKAAVITFSPPALGEDGLPEPPLAPSGPRKPATTLQGHAPPPPPRRGGGPSAPQAPSPPTMRPIEGRAARPEHTEVPSSGPKPARTSASPEPQPVAPTLLKRASGPYSAVTDPRDAKGKAAPVLELDADDAMELEALDEPMIPEPVVSLGPAPDAPELALDPPRPSGGLGAIVAAGDFFPAHEPAKPELTLPLPAANPVAFQRGSAIATAESAPLLIDVTPLSLRVETVAGYSDVLIAANSPVPCEKARTFLTASDHQTVVFIRVAQGESSRFAENTYLGELELSGLKPATRGAVKILVTFELDADGILNVRAQDKDTGRETVATMRLLGAHTDARDVAAMEARQARHVVM